ncbi:MAG: tetratricopeptide repeat protein [Woeseiaceae bacterium]|nr:tetratricopeptide repeat protein [Woeseiaceae bacterium]
MRKFSRIFLAAFLLVVSPFAFSGDFKKGWDAYSSTDYATALAEWQELADAGDKDAAYGMGLLYGNGFGVDMNDDLALKYYGVAADQGHADAQFNLAVMHQNGWGVPQSDDEANKWYERAADQGMAQAQMALGRYYALDFLDSYDPIVAYKWFSLAEKLGNVDAGVKREFIASRMTSDQVIEADGQVNIWMDRHRTLFADN